MAFFEALNFGKHASIKSEAKGAMKDGATMTHDKALKTGRKSQYHTLHSQRLAEKSSNHEKPHSEKQRSVGNLLSLPKVLANDVPVITKEGTCFEDYTRIESLGAGTYATVWKVKSNLTGEIFAAKLLQPHKFSYETRMRVVQMFKCEIMNLARCQCPGVVKLQEVVYGREGWLVVQEFIDDGTVWKESLCKTEIESFIHFMQLLQAVLFLQEHDIVHRDLKPTNILRCSSKRITIADFGWSEATQHCQLHRMEWPGTLEINPPEVLNFSGPLSEKLDNYAIGMNLLLFISGKFPCRPRGLDVTQAAPYVLRAISILRNSKPPEEFKHSLEAWEIFLGLTAPNPFDRWSLTRVLHHPWVSKLLLLMDQRYQAFIWHDRVKQRAKLVTSVHASLQKSLIGSSTQTALKKLIRLHSSQETEKHMSKKGIKDAVSEDTKSSMETKLRDEEDWGISEDHGSHYERDHNSRQTLTLTRARCVNGNYPEKRSSKESAVPNAGEIKLQITNFINNIKRENKAGLSPLSHAQGTSAQIRNAVVSPAAVSSEGHNERVKDSEACSGEGESSEACAPKVRTRLLPVLTQEDISPASRSTATTYTPNLEVAALLHGNNERQKEVPSCIRKDSNRLEVSTRKQISPKCKSSSGAGGGRWNFASTRDSAQVGTLGTLGCRRSEVEFGDEKVQLPNDGAHGVLRNKGKYLEHYQSYISRNNQVGGTQHLSSSSMPYSTQALISPRYLRSTRRNGVRSSRGSIFEEKQTGTHNYPQREIQPKNSLASVIMGLTAMENQPQHTSDVSTNASVHRPAEEVTSPKDFSSSRYIDPKAQKQERFKQIEGSVILQEYKEESKVVNKETRCSQKYANKSVLPAASESILKMNTFGFVKVTENDNKRASYFDRSIAHHVNRRSSISFNTSDIHEAKAKLKMQQCSLDAFNRKSEREAFLDSSSEREHIYPACEVYYPGDAPKEDTPNLENIFVAGARRFTRQLGKKVIRGTLSIVPTID